MSNSFEKRRPSPAYRLLSAFTAITFATSVVMPPRMAAAQVMPTVLNLPAVGTMVPLSSGFTPAMVTGITVHPENPLAFDFIIGTGDKSLDDAAFKEESRKLVKYFLATLTVPNRELWVNLSPYEKDRVVPPSFGNTEMGRDMLAQDYILKQLTASLMYPEGGLGKKFWDRVYRKAREKYGTSEVPMNTFNKIWIVPRDAVVYEHGNSAFVIKSHLKVMLEEDYVALGNNLGVPKYGLDSISNNEAEVISGVTSEVVREVLIPEIEKEVNEGETFANLRQIYNSVILATWYERNLKGGLLGQLYVDRNKTKGVDNEDKDVTRKIYDQYVEAFKKGVYNYIREDVDPASNEIIPRKYFSGGTNMDVEITTVKSSDQLSQKYSKDINGIVSSPVKKVEVNLADIGPGASDIAKAVAGAEGIASSPVTQGEREQILKEDWKYYSEKFNGYLSRLRGREEGAKSDLIDFLNDVGKTMDEEMADFPVEARYPLLKAAALLGKSDRQVLLNIIKENRSKFKSDLADAIPMMFDLVPPGWLEKRAPQMRGRVIYTVSPENLLLAGGLGYVMQVHEKFMHELGARVVSIEPMYKYRKDMHGALQPLDYETDFGIQDKREIGRDSVDVGGHVTGVRYWKGKLLNGKEVIFIEEIPREGEALRYTNTVYDYNNFGNRSWEEFSAFFGKAFVKLVRMEEERRRDDEKGYWKPAVVWGNDSQAAGAMALVVQEKNRARDDNSSVFRDIYPVFSTHTFGNRQNFGLDQIDRILGQLLGLEKKYYSAGIRFNLIDMASLAIRLVDGAGGLVNMVSRKHKVVLDRDQFDPDAKTVAITNGDDLSRAWDLVKDIYKDIYNRDLKDVDDLTWQEARSVVEEAVRRSNTSFVDEGVNDLGLDPGKPTVIYAGRLINHKVSPFRTFTERNIKRLVADGFNVVVFGRLQNYKESMDLADNYRRIEKWIAAQKEADPKATAGWGSFVFKGQYNDTQKQLMLIASNLVALDSDDETGTSEWTEVNGAIALSWILASPWRLRAPDSQKVILGEGILAEANEKGINLVVPEVPQNVLVEEINVMRAKRYNRQTKDIIAEVEDAYYETIKSKLSEAKSDPETFYTGAVQSAKIARVVNGYNTAAAYLTQWSKNLGVQSQWLTEARRVSKIFVAGLNVEQKQQLLNGERNGIRNFVFHVPPIASISVRERVFESGGGLWSFRIIKGAIEAEVWDGTLGHLRNGDYVKYLDGLTKGLKGQEEVLTWLNGLVVDNELSWYKKDLIFSEFVGTLINGLENRRGGETSSSPVSKEEGARRIDDLFDSLREMGGFRVPEVVAGWMEAAGIDFARYAEGGKVYVNESFEPGANIVLRLSDSQAVVMTKDNLQAITRDLIERDPDLAESFLERMESSVHFRTRARIDSLVEQQEELKNKIEDTREVITGIAERIREKESRISKLSQEERAELQNERETGKKALKEMSGLVADLRGVEKKLAEVREQSRPPAAPVVKGFLRGMNEGDSIRIADSNKVTVDVRRHNKYQVDRDLFIQGERSGRTFSIQLTIQNKFVVNDKSNIFRHEFRFDPAIRSWKHSVFAELYYWDWDDFLDTFAAQVDENNGRIKISVGHEVMDGLKQIERDNPYSSLVNIPLEDDEKFETIEFVAEFPPTFSPVEARDLYRDFYDSFGAKNKTDGAITGKDVGAFSQAFLSPDAQLLPYESRRNNGTLGVTEVNFLEDSATRQRMTAFQQQLKAAFGDKVYLVDSDKLHFTIQGLETQWDDKDAGTKKELAMHSGLEAIDMERGVISEVRERARNIVTPSFKMQVAGLNWNPQTGIFWELRPYLADSQEDPVMQRRKAWDLPQPRPPHVTAAYFTQEFNPEDMTKLRQLVAQYQNSDYFGDIAVNNVEVIAYTDFSFNAGYKVLENVPLTASSPMGASEDADGIIDRMVDHSQAPGSPAAELLKRESDYSRGVEKISTDQEIISDNRVPVSSPAGVHGPEEEVGGINLDPALLDLQIKRDGNGVPLPLPMQPIKNMHIEGFLPIIINVTPITNLPMLLGLADTEQDADEITPAMKARELEEISALN